MARHGIAIIDGYEVPATKTVAATLAAGISRAVITSFKVMNYSNAAETLTVWIDSDGTVSDNGQQRTILAIPAYGDLQVTGAMGIGLVGGGTISVQASTVTTLNIHVTTTQYFD